MGFRMVCFFLRRGVGYVKGSGFRAFRAVIRRMALYCIE